ncbi:MAG: GNAT family N-acetyltransferase [Xanthomonadaceae bacterium]|jgi:GNAT superfamily N-acetyltransferase|nr:GNAT family N-acetyltransferase [Xanthomonadaceae bacterium]
MRIEFLADHPQHALTLARWHHREWGELMPDWTRGDAERELIGHATRRDIPTTLILLDDTHALVGSVSVLDEDASEFRDLSPWLASLYVAPPARGRGLGAQLAHAAVDHARSMGVPRLYLFTPEHAAFYARLGWSVLGTRMLGEREVTLMAIELAPPPADR